MISCSSTLLCMSINATIEVVTEVNIYISVISSEEWYLWTGLYVSPQLHETWISDKISNINDSVTWFLHFSLCQIEINILYNKVVQSAYYMPLHFYKPSGLSHISQ